MSADPNKLPAARLVPKDRAEQMALLRSQASDGARKAGRTAVSVGKGLAVLALCGAGLGAVAAVGGPGRSRSRALDDLDRQIKTLRQFDLRTIPKVDSLELERLRAQLDSLELERLRAQLYRDLRNPNLGSPHRRYQFQQLELMGEPLHQSR